MTLNWDMPLPQTLRLRRGGELRTLGDAGRFALDRYGSIIKSEGVEHMLNLLLRAAETGRQSDVAAAADQLKQTLAASREI